MVHQEGTQSIFTKFISSMSLVKKSYLFLVIPQTICIGLLNFRMSALYTHLYGVTNMIIALRRLTGFPCSGQREWCTHEVSFYVVCTFLTLYFGRTNSACFRLLSYFPFVRVEMVILSI